MRARILMLALMVVSVFNPLVHASQDQVIRIGFIGSLSGPVAFMGKQTLRGLKLGLEYGTQGTMRINGKKIELLERDDQFKPDVGKQHLISYFRDEQVDIAVGSSTSGVTKAMLPVAERYGKLLIVEPAQASSITGKDWNPYIFRTGYNSWFYAASNAMIKVRPGTHVMMMAQNYSFGKDTLNAYKSTVERLGGHWVGAELLPFSTTDFKAPMQRVFQKMKKLKGPKVLFIAWAGSVNAYAKVLREKPQRYDIDTYTGGNTIPILKGFKKFKGMEGTSYYYYKIPKNPMNDWLTKTHLERFNSPPDFFVAGGMSAASAILTALKTAKTTDAKKLIPVMEGMSFQTPKGEMQFRKQDHQALQDSYHFRLTTQKGVDHAVPELIRILSGTEVDIPIQNQP